MKILHINLRKNSISLLVLILILASASVMAETSSIYYVDLTQGLPEDWTIINGGNTADTWTYLEGGFGVFCDDRSVGSSVLMDEQLISPIVDCSRLITVIFEYYHNFNGGRGTYTNQGDVYVSNDGGLSWVNVATYLPGSLSQYVVKIDITNIAAGYSKVMIKFHFRDFGSYGYWWQIFNVKISGEVKEILDTPVDAIENLIQDIKDMNLNKGTQTSLISKLNSAIQFINNGDYNEAIATLKAFTNEVKAQSGKKLTILQADYLIDGALYIINIL